MKVLKFGGSSVADRDAVRSVAAIVERAAAEGSPVIVVCSALQGVTDGLIDLAKRAAAGQADREAEVLALAERHLDIARGLIPPQRFGSTEKDGRL